MRWGVDEPEDPTALLVDGGDAFVVGPHSVTDRDPADGHLRWAAEVEDAEAAIAADGATVVVAAVDGFEALDRASGRSRWRAGIDDPDDRGRLVGLGSTPTGPVAVAVTDRGVVSGMDARTGDRRWSRTLAGAPQGEVVTDPGTGVAVVAMDRGDHVDLHVLDATNGATRWVRPLGAAVGLPLVDGGRLVVATGKLAADGVVRAYDLATGAPRWETAVPASSEPDQGPVLDGSAILSVGNAGVVTALDRTTGARRWERDLPDFVFHGRPVLVGPVAIVRSVAGEFFTFDRRTGRPRGRMVATGAGIGFGAGRGGMVLARGDVMHHQLVGLPGEMATERSSWHGSYSAWTPHLVRESLRAWRRTHGPTREPAPRPTGGA
jgi:outer membrane protein assembly factor BamB